MDKVIGLIALALVVLVVQGIAYIGVGNFLGIVLILIGAGFALYYALKRERAHAEEAKSQERNRLWDVLHNEIDPFVSIHFRRAITEYPLETLPSPLRQQLTLVIYRLSELLPPLYDKSQHHKPGGGMHPFFSILKREDRTDLEIVRECHVTDNDLSNWITYDQATALAAELKTLGTPLLPFFGEAFFRPQSRTREDYVAGLENWRTRVEQAITQDATQQAINEQRLILGSPWPNQEGLLSKQSSLLPLTVTQAQRFRHTYIIGKTGSGKSTLLKSLIAQDLARNVGVIVISPENGLFDDLTALIPPQRFNDVLYFDPTDTRPPVIGFNPFAFEQGEDLAQKAEETTSIFKAALEGDATLGVKMLPLLQNALYALLQQPGATLNDLDRLLYPQDASLRRTLLRLPHLDERTRKFWQDYEQEKENGYYKTAYKPLINRFEAFLRPPLVDILSTPSFSFHRVINERPTILFCNLSKLRGVQAQVVGQLLLSQLQQTLLRRDFQPEQSRIPFFLFIDEFQTYAATSEGALVELFNRARKYKMGVTLAHQVTADIPQKLLSVITGNVGTLITMQVSAEDAPFFTKELQLKDTEGHARPDLLQNLRVGQAFVRTPDPALTAGVPITIQPTSPPPGRDVFAYSANLKKVSKLNFGKQPQAQANGKSDEAFTPPPPEEEQPAQASARRKTTSRKAKSEPPPPPDDEESFKM